MSFNLLRDSCTKINTTPTHGVAVPTDASFTIHIDELLSSDVDVIVLVNPNAPTGKLLTRTEVERLIQGFHGLVVVDEAYMDFVESDETAIPLIARYPNLLVVRTFSKAYALSGARVGYCMGNERLIAALEKTKAIYNVNTLSRQFALAALQDQSYFSQMVTAIRHTRDVYTEKLRGLGWEVVASQTNFLLCTPPKVWGEETAEMLYEKWMEEGVYVRYIRHPRLTNKLRISIGTECEMEMLYAQLDKLLK